jgi:DNA polymerase-3 subunit gamma/tau
MVLKTASDAGITLLSGVSDEKEAIQLTKQFSVGELLRIMNELQQTMTGFTRGGSRRVDAELCILSLCQPELSLDAESLNARLTRLEDQIKSGAFTVSAVPAPAVETIAEQPPVIRGAEDALLPPVILEEDVPSEQEELTPAPIGFWTELAAAVRKELRPPVSGFFAPTANAPVQGELKGNRLVLRCTNSFTVEMVDKPAITELVSRKASAQLGRPITVTVMDITGKPDDSGKMEQLLNFSRNHSDIIKIKE